MQKIVLFSPLLLLLCFPLFLFFNLGRMASTDYLTQEIVWEQNFTSENYYFYNSNELPQIGSYHVSSSNFLAFLDSHGQIVHQRQLKNNQLASTSRCCYLLYEKLGKTSTFFLKSGEQVFQFKQNGYGLLSPDGTLVVFLSTDGSLISVYDRTGKKYTQNLFVDTLITDISFSDYNNSFAVGGINGKVIVIDHQGKTIFKEHLNQNNYPVIKGIALSHKGDWLVAVNGHQPERIHGFWKEGRAGEIYKKRWTVETGQSRAENVVLKIDERNEVLYEQSKNGIVKRNLKNGKELASFYSPSSEEKPRYTIIELPIFQNQQDAVLEEHLIALNVVDANSSHVSLLFSDNLEPVWQKSLATAVLDMKLIYHEEYYYLLTYNQKQVTYYRFRFD